MHSTPLEIEGLAKIEELCSFAKCNFTSCRHLESFNFLLHAMRGVVSCDITNRQTGAVKMATAEEIKLLLTNKNLADGSHRNLMAQSSSLEELLSIETGLTVCSHMKLA